MELKNISIITSGSRGDVQPYLALALVLKERGYNVRFLTNANFQEMIEPFGFGFCPIFPDMCKSSEINPSSCKPCERKCCNAFIWN
jgi:UDP:flavonoid glycosyltransferase YjiC (YdhE family)